MHQTRYDEKENMFANSAQQPGTGLNTFDYSVIEEMDPSLGKLSSLIHYLIAEGHTLVFDREAPFELRIQDPNTGPQEVGTLEAIRLKILVK